MIIIKGHITLTCLLDFNFVSLIKSTQEHTLNKNIKS